MDKIRVLIIDDSKFVRTLFTGLLSEYKDIEVVDTASDAFEARDKIKLYNPDVVTLDIEMPKMDGISFLDKIMSLRPMPVVMVSTLTAKGADITLRALEIGAVDYITKPSEAGMFDNIQVIGEELAGKIRLAAKANVRKHTATAAPKRIRSDKEYNHNKIIAIGASTGGVEAIKEVLVRLPANCPPVIITQHMPERFTESFANRLNGMCEITVSEGRDGQVIEPGHAYIAPGNYHMEIVKNSQGKYALKVTSSDLVSGHRPSVDVMFESVANVVKGNAVGVILTGMGRDGANGMLSMKNAGGYTIGQNKDTSIVYGMPKAANDIGAVAQEFPLTKIADEVLKQCS